jgi:catechol 2,3-dioxygenase-like lactoylglutathione lyase family enzyme
VTEDLRAAGLITTIPVADLDRAFSFYTDVLGFEHLQTSEAGVLLRARDGRLLLYHSSAPGPMHTLAGFEVERLEPVIETLVARGVTFDDYDFPTLKTVDHIAWIGPERAAWFHDSEGNILSISESWGQPPDETAR